MQVGFFETPFGRIGVMICYDAENDTFVDEMLAAEPVLVLNPIHSEQLATLCCSCVATPDCSLDADAAVS
eukprot:SAG11_NODE_9456_length_910_cov_0.933416_2_plen_70_part_00